MTDRAFDLIAKAIVVAGFVALPGGIILAILTLNASWLWMSAAALIFFYAG